MVGLGTCGSNISGEDKALCKRRVCGIVLIRGEENRNSGSSNIEDREYLHDNVSGLARLYICWR